MLSCVLITKRGSAGAKQQACGGVMELCTLKSNASCLIALAWGRVGGCPATDQRRKAAVDFFPGCWSGIHPIGTWRRVTQQGAWQEQGELVGARKDLVDFGVWKTGCTVPVFGWRILSVPIAALASNW